MSTRANVILAKPSWDDYLLFYRHSDGYPEGTLPHLEQFMGWVKEDRIRDNVSQSAGWLVMLGALEYRQYQLPYERWHSWLKVLSKEEFKTKLNRVFGKHNAPCHPSKNESMGWKVGAFEPASYLAGDIEYLYMVDLDKKEIRQIPRSQWKQWENKFNK